MRKMKDSGIEWIGMIPEGWSVIPLKRLVSINSNTLPEDTNPDYEFDYVDIGSVSYSKGIERTERMVFSSSPSRARRVVSEGDIIVSTVRTYLRAIASITCPNNLVVSTGFAVLSPYDVKSMFLKYSSLSEYFVAAVEAKSTGISYPAINATDVGLIKIVVPPQSEQQRIADYLDRKCAKIDDTIDKQRVVIEKLKAYKQSVITHAVTKGLNPNAPMKDSGIEWIGKIPEHWDVVRMKTLGDARNGLTYKPEDCVEEGKGTLVLRSSNIVDGCLKLTDNVYVNASISESLMVHKDDMLICSRNGSRSLIGKNVLIGDNVCASFGAFMMIFRSEHASYVHKILNSHVFSFYLGTFLTSTINQLTLGNFNNMQVVFCPDKGEQRQIADYLDKKCADIDTAIAKKEALIEKLAAYKKSLIYECVTGKREVV